MKERPIIFNSEMVNAILEGRKSQTRRVINPQPESSELCPVLLCHDSASPSGYSFSSDMIGDIPIKCPYGKVGDLLWVRETFYFNKDYTGYVENGGRVHDATQIIYCSDMSQSYFEYYEDKFLEHIKEPFTDDIFIKHFCEKKPSIFMPKWACRLWLKVTDIRVERVQDISEEDAKAEGVIVTPDDCWGTELKPNQEAFRILWDSINKKRGYGWNSNPWVFIVEFEKINKK